MALQWHRFAMIKRSMAVPGCDVSWVAMVLVEADGFRWVSFIYLEPDLAEKAFLE